MGNIEIIVLLSILLAYCLIKIIKIGKSESLMTSFKSAPNIKPPKTHK